jgi:hypothetical protein
MNTTESKFQVGDLVYIPSQDPKANTIWTIEHIRRGQVDLFHLSKGEVSVGLHEIAESPF